MTGIADIPVRELRGVGPRLAEKLADYGVFRVEDLLFHLPLRYQDRTRVTPIAAAREGDDVVIEGEVRAADVVFGRRRSLVARVQDGSGTLTLRFFHFSAAQKNNLGPGTRLRCFGQVRRGSSGLEIYHPEYRQLREGDTAVEDTLTPIYPTTAGIGQAQWRKLCAQALNYLQRSPPRDLLPPGHDLSFDLAEALYYLHAPPPDAPQQALREGHHPAQLRLAIEELVAHNLSLQQLRNLQQAEPAPVLPPRDAELQAFLDTLPFSPTAAQRRVMAEIAADVAMSAANLYRYFENKQDIAAACAKRYLLDRIAFLREIVQRPGLAAPERLEAFVVGVLRYTHEVAAEQPKINELVETIASERQDLVYWKADAECALIAEILQQGVADREFDVADPLVAARAVHSSLALFQVPLFMAIYALPEFEQRARDLVALLIRGLARR